MFAPADDDGHAIGELGTEVRSHPRPHDYPSGQTLYQPRPPPCSAPPRQATHPLDGPALPGALTSAKSHDETASKARVDDVRSRARVTLCSRNRYPRRAWVGPGWAAVLVATRVGPSTAVRTTQPV